ncbi:MAG: hypothetical protein ABIO67_01200 [Mycobacteriales bacterium]
MDAEATIRSLQERLRFPEPTLEVSRPLVEGAARKAVIASSGRGQAPRMSVRVTSDKITVAAVGKGAGAALADVRRSLDPVKVAGMVREDTIAKMRLR